MIKPKRLYKGDKVAIVSLSRGMIGEKMFIHKYELAKKRLEEYGLEVVAIAFSHFFSTFRTHHYNFLLFLLLSVVPIENSA